MSSPGPSPDSGRLDSGAIAFPLSNDCVCSCPSRHTVTRSAEDSAFTTETPTPWSPPETWYPDDDSPPPNLPPACRTVSTVSSDDLPVAGWIAVGIPRPSSATVTHPDSRSTETSTFLASPAWTSSIELSRIS